MTHPDVPEFRGGNLLVFERPPEAADLERWCELFDRSVGVPPAIGFRAFGWDGLDGEVGDTAAFIAAGFELERTVVLAAPRLLPPERPNRDVRLAAVTDDAGWEAAVDVQASESARPGYRSLVAGVMRANRRVAEAGHGVWWGAFVGDVMVATMGVFRVGDLARTQAIVTRAGWRGRGIASTLLHHAAESARAAWGTELLVLEAEADVPALNLYQRVGLALIEWRAGLGQRAWTPRRL